MTKKMSLDKISRKKLGKMRFIFDINIAKKLMIDDEFVIFKPHYI